MNRKQRIHKLLENNFDNFQFNVKDQSHLHAGHHNFSGSEESHFKIKLTQKIPEELDRLIIHRKIYELLKEEFQNGLHSIEIQIN